ncbi:MAG: hypothetical protein IJ272_05445 [Clostridia bacterium]|nr:hypothetical protein [Clostridia bacterium]
MKKYLKMIPVVFWHYIGFVLVTIMAKMPDTYYKEVFNTANSPDIMTLLIWIWSGVALIILAQNVWVTVKGKYTSKEVARVNLFVKCSAIPLYLIQMWWVLLGYEGSEMWAKVIFMLVFSYDVVFVTGVSAINAIGCTIRLKKDDILSNVEAVLMGIVSCIWLIDIVVAIIYVIKTNKDSKLDSNSEETQNTDE